MKAIETRQPGLDILLLPPTDVDAWRDGMPSEYDIRLVRGALCTRRKDLFNEWSAAFQLPVSFGYDWDALHDALSGNDWTDAEDAIMLISNAHLLLADETEEEQSTLFDILCDVLESDDSTLNKEAGQTLKIFLHTTTEDYEKLENLLGNLSHASSDPA